MYCKRTVGFAAFGSCPTAYHSLLLQINVPTFFRAVGVFQNEGEDGAPSLDSILFLGRVGLEGAVDELEGFGGWV